jgi:hypothetical protein
MGSILRRHSELTVRASLAAKRWLKCCSTQELAVQPKACRRRPGRVTHSASQNPCSQLQRKLSHLLALPNQIRRLELQHGLRN